MAIPAVWTLSGGGITVFYTPAGGGTFHYVHPPTTLTFAGAAQINVVPVPALGTLVSVTLSISPIAETTFTVLLPNTEVDAAHPVAAINTEGISTNHLLFPPFGQKEFYTVTALTGSAFL
jgi:hypothetical protein